MYHINNSEMCKTHRCNSFNVGIVLIWEAASAEQICRGEHFRGDFRGLRCRCTSSTVCNNSCVTTEALAFTWHHNSWTDPGHSQWWPNATARVGGRLKGQAKSILIVKCVTLLRPTSFHSNHRRSIWDRKNSKNKVNAGDWRLNWERKEQRGLV